VNDRLARVKDAVIDTLRDQNGGTPLSELRERVVQVHRYSDDPVRKAIMQLIDSGALIVGEDRKIYRR
jgi:hypothetical protein